MTGSSPNLLISEAFVSGLPGEVAQPTRPASIITKTNSRIPPDPSAMTGYLIILQPYPKASGVNAVFSG
ncbi:hypothetical protein [Marinobacter confluentis]|uniref:Uncharacterized protein n=1 Tax=Marinobacter confluentis TaxID=1697557 RepID=A0A4Z1BEM4_9GAMM|nr:hypothetical protein [Marinobacter confluentis]TGN41094.1 hypothetical protein E5Q11_00630 [Marinobacter confluentis]